MATTAVIVGTSECVRTVERQLALLDRPPVLLGCVLHAAGSERYVRDIPVLGDLENLEDICLSTNPSLALVSLPSVMSDLVAATRTRLRRLGVPDRFIPTLADLVEGVGPRSEIDIDLPALIGRPPRALDAASIGQAVRDRCVLVTGAGGSIGSELCRILAGFGPREIAMVERGENALFEIDRQLARRWPGLPRQALLHDVVDATGTRELFAAVRPDVVFHAAAHKHVPMMEDHPGAAIDNNLFGTVSACDAAIAAGAARFVMVSTDKAVRPTSVMGMTKRLAELYVQHAHRAARDAGRPTSCSMVRFGNVLGSSGSVLETWKRQIADGGPVTVTDPRMTRYFMSIPEAAALVVQAAALQDPGVASGEIFVLDMGEPIRVVELAERFIQAHGLEAILPDARPSRRVGGVAVVYSGARTGEKLFEELSLDDEAARPTAHPGIRVWRGAEPDHGAIQRMLDELAPHRRSREAASVAEAIRHHVPEVRRAEVGTHALERAA